MNDDQDTSELALVYRDLRAARGDANRARNKLYQAVRWAAAWKEAASMYRARAAEYWDSLRSACEQADKAESERDELKFIMEGLRK